MLNAVFQLLCICVYSSTHITYIYVHCSCGGVGENVRKINQTEPGEFNLQLISIYSVLCVCV